jgi:hypothetical protein
MKHYCLVYRQTVLGEETKDNWFWRCQAEDYNHAVEQLRDEVEHCEGEKLVYCEEYKDPEQ